MRWCTADAEWCGPCLCLVQTYKGILFANDTLLSEAMEKEGKTVKYWKACAEKIEGLEEYHGTALPHLLIYLEVCCCSLHSCWAQ